MEDHRACSCTSVAIPVAMAAGGLLGWRTYGVGGMVIGILAAIPVMGVILLVIARMLRRKRR